MARRQLSRKVTWWLGEQTQKRLVTWTRLLLLPVRRFYQILLQNTGTGYHNWVSCTIQANCQMFAGEPVKVQFELTQGILAHEAGHARYTDHATQRGPLLHQVINLLEDQRIENAMITSLPALESTFLRLRRQMWKRIVPVSGPPNYQALDLCLDWRFAHHFVDETTMLTRLGVHPDAVKLWREVRPWVEKAWTECSTAEVEIDAQKIIDILDLSASGRPLTIGNLRQVDGDDVEAEREEKALPSPTGADTQVALGAIETDLDDSESDIDKTNGDLFEEDDYTQPVPYIDLEAEADPIANAIASKLMLPDPTACLSGHLYKGRYSARQAIRNPEKPFLFHQNQGVSGRGTCIDIWADRSGSMDRFDHAVQLALMAIYKGSGHPNVRIPVGLGFFGGQIVSGDRIMRIAPIGAARLATTKSLIAGFHGTTSNEFLHWALADSYEALTARSEERKILIVIHDGMPVYRGDWDMSLADLKRMDADGIFVIGVYLGEEGDDCTGKLNLLFQHLIICHPGQLPEKLGNILTNIA